MENAGAGTKNVSMLSRLLTNPGRVVSVLTCGDQKLQAAGMSVSDTMCQLSALASALESANWNGAPLYRRSAGLAPGAVAGAEHASCEGNIPGLNCINALVGQQPPPPFSAAAATTGTGEIAGALTQPLPVSAALSAAGLASLLAAAGSCTAVGAAAKPQPLNIQLELAQLQNMQQQQQTNTALHQRAVLSSMLSQGLPSVPSAVLSQARMASVTELSGSAHADSQTAHTAAAAGRSGPHADVDPSTWPANGGLPALLDVLQDSMCDTHHPGNYYSNKHHHPAKERGPGTDGGRRLAGGRHGEGLALVGAGGERCVQFSGGTREQVVGAAGAGDRSGAEGAQPIGWSAVCAL